MDTGHYDHCEIMTGEEFNKRVIDEEEYNKECDAQLYEDGPVG